MFIIRFNIFRILFFILLTGLFTQCKEDKDEEREIPKPTKSIGVSEELKSYYYFPEGSWWIYQRKDTNAIVYDTAIVVENQRELIFEPDIIPYEWELLRTNIDHSYFEAFPIYDNLKTFRVLFENAAGSDDVLNSLPFGEILGPYTFFFTVPIDSALISENSRNGGGSSILYDTSDVTLKFGTVMNVAHIERKGSNFSDTILLAKDIGIIKFYSSENNSSWELINYQINN